MSQGTASPAQSAEAAARVSRPLPLAARQARLAWLLLLPVLAVVLLIALVPLLQTIAASFTNARMASIEPTRFVGLANYAALLGDYLFWQSVRVTLTFAALTVTAELVLGLIVALVVNSRFRGRGLM